MTHAQGPAAFFGAVVALAAAVGGCSGGGSSSASTPTTVAAIVPHQSPTPASVSATTPPSAAPPTATPRPATSAAPSASATPAPVQSVVVLPSPSPSPSPVAPAAICLNNAKYNLALAQQFNDTNSWRIDNGGVWFTEYQFGRTNPGAVDAAYYMDKSLGIGTPPWDPFSITPSASGNLLTISAQPASTVPGLMPAQVENQPYVSGVISTSGQNAPGQGYSQRYGYYEVAAQLPKGQGVWPAFWMLDAYGSRSEVDVFEFLGNDTSTIYQSVHYTNGTGGSYGYKVSFDPTAGLHRYGVLITPTTDNYYVDGVQTHSVPDASVNNFYFMVSLQIGGPGSWPGPPDSTTTWPAKLYVQYFHAYAPANTSC